MPNNPERHSASRPGQPEGTLPIDVINYQYDGQWVLVKVTELDERRTPLAGSVIAHGARKRVHDRLTRIAETIAATNERPDMPYYIFSAGSHVSLSPQGRARK